LQAGWIGINGGVYKTVIKVFESGYAAECKGLNDLVPEDG
jgi:hypothetical protein